MLNKLTCWPVGRPDGKMAKASVKLTCTKCGAEFTAQKTCYNRTEADNWENYMSRVGGTCTDCWKVEKEAEKLAAREKQTAENASGAAQCPVTFPALEGSEKQIAWATDLRNGIITAMVNSKAQWDKIEELSANPEFKKEWDKLNITSAKWWIDNRFTKIFKFIIGEKY